MNSKERFEQFYEYAASANFSAPIVGDYYECIIKDTAYATWRASRKAALEEAASAAERATPRHTECWNKIAAKIRQMMEE